MEELVKELKPVFQKIADFFDLFDLSFMVSGVATSSAIVFYLMYSRTIDLTKYISSINGFMVFILVVVVYIIGLVSWSFGKIFHKWKRGKIYGDVYNQFLLNNASGSKLLGAYLGKVAQKDDKYDEESLKKSMEKLYGMLWVKIRDSQKVPDSFSLLKRYWVQTATFEGLIFSAFVWLVLILLLTFYCSLIPTLIGLFFAVLCIISGFVVMREAGNYREYQLSELVQTFISIEPQS